MSDLRHVYEGSGLTRVCVDGQHVITGGSDGVVALFLTKRWPTSSALWARKCHGDSAVTCAVLDDKLSLAITAGRDGRVVLHERIHDAPESVSSRDLCRLKGEVRCLLYDAPRKRIFVGGNAFHCLHMRENKYEISTYPLPSEFAASPITAASVSPCGQLIALANTAGQITLLSSTIPPTSSETLPSEEESAGPYAKVRTRIVERTFTSRSKTDDNTAYNLSLVQSVSGLFLFVPTSTNVSVYKVELKDGTTPHLRLATSLTTGTDGYHGAVAYSTSVKDMACVVGTIHRTVSFKLSDGKRGLTSSIHRQREHQSEETTATALSVCVATGDVAVGLNNGSILLLPKFSKSAFRTKEEGHRGDGARTGEE
ncbi:hypothetical protein AGDE_16096 [Angomonas deanei]|uniref:WD domain, G-beta repeat n=1 Tax=Angomonas deanei TaxID=59799 RepID=A0A7G2CII6_9TRYP|nr:hypothetical protein AGDE_16096 [Angomonas deanei]CAD2219185.1 hypothetical protein, conserved [Angomonas deanei]|eukprot:EPY17717.1 hypothetical protein AGDE_16096 [Angomonas deanei]